MARDFVHPAGQFAELDRDVVAHDCRDIALQELHNDIRIEAEQPQEDALVFFLHSDILDGRYLQVTLGLPAGMVNVNATLSSAS